MYSIGQLSSRTNVKVPTIRYYEGKGLLAPLERTEGNQRRYDTAGVQRLSFIKHARNLGFSLKAISSLIQLQSYPDSSCQEATQIADAQLADVQNKIEKLRTLEKELVRISEGCNGQGASKTCYVLASLADHKHCNQEH